MAFREHKYRLERPWNSHQSPTSEFATSVINFIHEAIQSFRLLKSNKQAFRL